jgi:glycosyltransferase involved in cell wall biosynthesis
MKPRISVALCSLNGGRFIGAQLESILSQTQPPDEIVVADDGSEDDTLAAIDKVSRRAPGIIRLIQNPANLGVTRNFEQAIARTTGDIIFLSDQDDVWVRERVAAMLQAFAAGEGVGLVYSDAIMVSGDLEPWDRRFSEYLGLARYRQPTPAQVVKSEAEVAGCLIAFRSQLKPLVLPPVEGWVYDHKIAFIAHATSQVMRIDKPLMLHRRHGANASDDAFFFRRGFRNQLEAARGAAGIDVYVEDRRQWEAMLERLREIAAAVQVGPVLDDYIRECGERLALAQERERWRRMSRVRRAAPALSSLLRGRYHRYLRGFRTFGKDCWL